jgi:hypothetical protein
MLVFIGNQRGNIAIALALSIVGIMSGLTLSMFAFKDTMGARLGFDIVQQFQFLRSETGRAQTIVQKMSGSQDSFTLPTKNATIVSSDSKNTYSLQTEVQRADISTGGGIYKSDGYLIKTLATVQRGTNANPGLQRNESMVRSYSELGIRRTSFAGYHYFTDNEESMNGTPVYFWGPDVIHGKVHSNSDIWLKQGGGGNNNGWPTFLGPVYTTGEIKTYGGTPPYPTVFRKGYFEHVGELEFDADATEVQSNGMVVGPNNYSPNRIVYVTVNGSSFDCLIGTISRDSTDTTDVWQNYPPASGQYLFRNRFPHVDTIWTAGTSGSIVGSSAYVKSKLWLRGSFSGAQTWCSQDTLYLNDDCLLSGTPRGIAPDGGDTGNGPLNRSDFLGIVSEKSIVIQYGYKTPRGSTRNKPNCGSDADGIWIYAALCALGEGNGNSHTDGVFTFEYQHPHPSTTDRYVGQSLYTKIDLHRYKYPQNLTNPWPPTVDYPWYNPLWPESYGYMERGTIHLYGSVAQRRRGYVHRNVQDADYPNYGGVWNIPKDYCGGAAYPSGDGYNAPGATGNGVGYKKDYHFDNRFSFKSPPDFPQVHISGGITPYESSTWELKRPPRAL